MREILKKGDRKVSRNQDNWAHSQGHYSRLRVWRVCTGLLRGTLCRLTSTSKYHHLRWRGVGKLRNNEVDHYSVWKIFISVARTLDLFLPLPRMAERHI